MKIKVMHELSDGKIICGDCESKEKFEEVCNTILKGKIKHLVWMLEDKEVFLSEIKHNWLEKVRWDGT